MSSRRGVPARIGTNQGTFWVKPMVLSR
jgi:hypothetical protein